MTPQEFVNALLVDACPGLLNDDGSREYSVATHCVGYVVTAYRDNVTNNYMVLSLRVDS